MRIELPFAEGLAVVRSATTLPPLVRDLRCSGATVYADIDLREIESDSFGFRLAAMAAGTVEVAARLEEFADGVAVFVVTAHARGLPAHRLVPYLIGPIESALDRAGLPDGLVRVFADEGDPRVSVDVQRAVDERVGGVRVRDVSLVDAVIHVDADVSGFRTPAAAE
ncbi:hypothetical protein CLV46_1248 [Diaminobutyricimonas aerilata]|uniref:Uncharacterized protein n=1 Tax=Diaminobutyricimonas aerilata TaxID=1162967 RepID=A0A2M9CIL8_9MICO|nr:hypothetical protein [Diaminobutyricimonas aerilata]PJJ71695.1 hypothetical protein CLV46_1248 [Diaminobutyricimonas aerilata]